MDVKNLPTHAPDLMQAHGNLSRSLRQAENREQLFSNVAIYLHALSNARQTYRVNVGDENRGIEPSIELIADEFAELPANLDQIATTLAFQAFASDHPCRHQVNDQDVFMIAIPISTGSPKLESLVSLFVNGSQDGLKETAILQSAVNAIEGWDQRQMNRQGNQLASDVAAINEMHSHLKDAENLESSVRIIADELAGYLHQIADSKTASAAVDSTETGIEVLIGITEQFAAPKLTAISNLDAVPDNPKLIEVVESAMAEGSCCGHESHWPPENHCRQGLLCHQRMARELAKASLTTVPMNDNAGQNLGVLVVASVHRLSHRQQQFCVAFGQSIGPTLKLLKRAEQNRLEKAWNLVRESFRTQKGKTIVKFASVLCALSLIPLPYRVVCDCELRPTNRRFISAPFDSQLDKIVVEPGDLVTVGQVLGQLDEREILLELNENEAELHRAIKNSDGHLASHDSGEASLAQLDADRLRARNQLLKSRIENLELTSPIDGIIISGDLKDAVGRPLSKGDALFEIAPLDKLTVEVQIQEDDVRFVESSMNVSIRFNSLPFQSFTGNVLRVHPASELRDDNNVFVAVVNIENVSNELRPGMRGTARVSTSWSSTAWNFLHKPTAGCLRWFGW